MKEYIRDRLGRILGYTEENPNRITLYTQLGREIGYYDKRTKETWQVYPRRELKSREGNILGMMVEVI
jgi:hypothetical protein